jgi:hypothetical protein
MLKYINMSESPDVVVLAPDAAAGNDFSKVLASEGTPNIVKKVDWPARVVTGKDGKNEMNPDREGIAEAIAESIREVVTEIGEKTRITISCNTASVPELVNRARLKLQEKGIGSDKYELVTTLDAVASKYGEANEKPALLGTTVLSGQLSADEKFRTLEEGSDNGSALLSKVQEIIWRTKAVQGSDVSTAPIDVYGGDLSDETVYRRKLIELHDGLIQNGLDRVILGCTELPYAFGEMEKTVKAAGKEYKIETIDPAKVLSPYIKAKN